jgi:single-stranded-DNA-specific exonuclease
VLETQGTQIEAMLFGCADPRPARVGAAYRLGLDEYNGARRLQLTIEHWQALP